MNTTITPNLMTMTRGDSAQFQITVKTKGALQNLTGASFEFVARSCEPHRRCQIDKTTLDGSIAVANVASGQAILSLVPADTLSFPNEDVELETEWTLTDGIGNVTTVTPFENGPRLLVKRRLKSG
jgi:hypothetical protein